MRVLVLVFALLVTMVQEHKEPPAGWLCDNKPKTPADHRCECQRTCALNEETGYVEVKEDPKCKVWCFKAHCSCLNECDSH